MLAILLFDCSLCDRVIGEGDIGNTSCPTIVVKDDFNVIETNLRQEKSNGNVQYMNFNEERERKRKGKEGEEDRKREEEEEKEERESNLHHNPQRTP